MKYSKKPVVVEAIQFTHKNYDEIREFTGRKAYALSVPVKPNEKSFCKIQTLEGEMLAIEGDYIIKGVAGEFYPCKPDIFKATYEKVDNTKQTTNIHINVSVENAGVVVEEIAKKLEQMLKEASQ